MDTFQRNSLYLWFYLGKTKALLQGLLSFVKQNNFLCTKLIIFECDDSQIALHKYDKAKANKMQSFTDEV